MKTGLREMPRRQNLTSTPEDFHEEGYNMEHQTNIKNK